MTQPSEMPVWLDDALVEDVPRCQAETGRHEHADAEPEERQAEDATSQSLRRSIREQASQHDRDPTDGRVTPSW